MKSPAPRIGAALAIAAEVPAGAVFAQEKPAVMQSCARAAQLKLEQQLTEAFKR
jgi:hypothetical protein